MFTSRAFRDYVSLYNQLDLEDPYLCICVFNCSCVKRQHSWLKIDLKNQDVFISIQKKSFSTYVGSTSTEFKVRIWLVISYYFLMFKWF